MTKYQTNAAEIDRLARGLTPFQRALLLEIRDRYLRSEGPLSESDLANLGGMGNPDVRAVLNTAFERREGVWTCEQIEAEVEMAKAKVEQAKRAAQTRWESNRKPTPKASRMRSHAGFDAVAMRTQCIRNADAMRSHEIESGSGKDADLAFQGGDYRGGILKNIKNSNSDTTFSEPPHKVPRANADQANANPPAWLATVAGWFGRKDGAFEFPEKLQAEEIEKTLHPTDKDILTLGRYYQAAHPVGRDFRRRSLIALLRHWHGEMDRARMHAKATKAREEAL
jgi:uncharacterized protein YdaU (DUF1376 family)